MNQKIKDIIRHYNMELLPVEGTYFVSTYRAAAQSHEGKPASTAILGLYASELGSVSCFHRLTSDEVWHFYGGDPLELHLLHPDGSAQRVVMGPHYERGQVVQFVVPAGSWQGGRTAPGGVYSLYGCTVAPGFTEDCFQAATADTLIALYPNQKEIIEALSVNGNETCMPAL